MGIQAYYVHLMRNRLSRELCRPEAGQKFTVDGEDYVLGGEIGDGAVGLVRKATRLKDGTHRAVKFLAPDPKYIESEVFEDVAIRFRREGERGTKLDHQHLITIHYYCDNQDGCNFEQGEPKNPFLLMECIKGKTLNSYIHRSEEHGKFIITRPRLHIAIQIASALEDLHRKKLIHRDVKPANIFLSREKTGRGYPLVKLGDFGVMKWGDFHSSMSTGVLTATNQKGLGTLKYMSPELAIAPKMVSVRSDIYSLGITLFELFSAQVLATPHHVFEIINARLSKGTTASRYFSMGYNLLGQDEMIAELLLDMHLRGVSGRPTIEKIRGRLEVEYERRYESDWERDLAV
jgi:eukaryotic-like serine/threonine-protein kinase